MESRKVITFCSKFDLAGREWKIPHDFVHGVCHRCGEIESKELKLRQSEQHGKSKSKARFYNYEQQETNQVWDRA